MCLTHLNFYVDKVFKFGNSIKVYKKLILFNWNNNYNDWLRSCGHSLYIWKPGFNHFIKNPLSKNYVSELYRQGIIDGKSGVVEQGLHVYLDKNEAVEGNRNLTTKIVEFTAYSKDFIASGRNNKKTKGAVFTRLHLSKKEYNRVINETKGKNNV